MVMQGVVSSSAPQAPAAETTTVAFDLPRGRSRSKNVSSSVDTVTGEKKKRGRRSQSDSTKRQEQRLAKNRISAANSRKRRKKYIEQLEEKVLEAEE